VEITHLQYADFSEHRAPEAERVAFSLAVGWLSDGYIHTVGEIYIAHFGTSRKGHNILA
jgi:hypothetical protein